MKSVDVVNQLALLLPNQTDKFTTNVSITSLTRSGTTVTADCAAAHGLIVGKQVNVVGAQTPLTIASLTRAGTVGTLVTDNPHDITENYIDDVELSGSTEAEFNGTFTIISVPDRNTINFTMVDSGPTTATGSPLLLNGSSALQQYNGLHQVTAIPTTTQFQYEITDATLYSPAAGTILARTQPRVSAIASLDYLIDAYTQQPPNEYWAFVILGDVFASKSRRVDSDAVDNLQKGEHYRQQLIQPFSVVVVIPSSAEIQGRSARDAAEDMFRPICRSLLGSKLDSGLYVGKQNPINFVDHGTVNYNKSFYIHSYNFQTVSDLTFEDTIGYDLDVAFRDIDLSIFLDVGTGEDPLTATPNLDGTNIALPSAPVIYSELILSRSPLVYYKLDETSGTAIADSSGNGYNAVIGGAHTLNQPTLVNGEPSSISLNSPLRGSAAQITGPSLGAITFPITLEAWWQPTNLSGPSVIPLISTHYEENDYNGFNLYVATTGVIIALMGGGSGVIDSTNNKTYQASGISWSTLQKYHIIARFINMNTVGIFLNGVLLTTVYTGGTASAVGTSAGILTVGQFDSSGASSNDWFGIGLYDEVAVYNASLSDAQILENYNAGKIV